MGNQFTYYTTVREFYLNSADTIYSFAIINSNLPLSSISVDTGWVTSENDNGDSTYNLLFNYEPGSTPTAAEFSDQRVFFVKTGENDLTDGLEVQWTNITSNSGTASNDPIFSEPYNTETLNSTDNPVPCVFPDTEILTPKGLIQIRYLQPGDQILTPTGKCSTIIHKQITRLFSPKKLDRPVLIRKNALSPSVPFRDLYLTRYHRLRYKGKMSSPEKIQIVYRQLPDGFQDLKDTWPDSVEYHQLQLENGSDNFIANGLEIESLDHTHPTGTLVPVNPPI